MLSSPDWKLTLVTSHQVSLQCPTTKYPCSAQPPSIPAVPSRRVSLQCPTAEYPCTAQPQSIPAVPNCKVCLQCPTAECPCSVQPSNIPARSNRKVSLQVPSAKYPWSAQQQSINILAAHLQCWGGRETLHFLCNNGFRVGMLEMNNVDVVLVRLEADFRDQPPSIPAAQPPNILAVPNHQVSLWCPTTRYPCSAQPKYPCIAQSQSMFAVPNRRTSLHCPTATYPCSAQPLGIPAMPNHQVPLQCPTTKYPCSAQPQSMSAVPNRRVSIFLQRICSAARQTVDRGQGNVIYTSSGTK